MKNPLQMNSNYYSIIDFMESKSFSWIFIADHRDPWRATLSWITFFLFTFAFPVFSHFAFHHRKPYDWIVQASLSLFSTLSFVNLLRFTRKYGLRRFLFLDKQDCVGRLTRRYSEEVHRSTMLLCAFILPCSVCDTIYNIWWFASGGTHIPYIYNLYVSHAIACFMHMTWWLYRTSLFLLVCVLFKLTCSLQILRLDDFAQVFEKLSDVGPILVQHLAIKRNLRVISHRFRSFILLTLILVTMSQFASLLVTTVDGSFVNISTTGELAAFPKGSPLLPLVSTALLQVTENELDSISDTWLGRKADCSEQNGRSGSRSGRLSLDSFLGLFLIAGASSTSAVIIYLFIFLYENKEMLLSDGSILQKLSEMAQTFHQEKQEDSKQTPHAPTDDDDDDDDDDFLVIEDNITNPPPTPENHQGSEYDDEAEATPAHDVVETIN